MHIPSTSSHLSSCRWGWCCQPLAGCQVGEPERQMESRNSTYRNGLRNLMIHLVMVVLKDTWLLAKCLIACWIRDCMRSSSCGDINTVSTIFCSISESWRGLVSVAAELLDECMLDDRSAMGRLTWSDIPIGEPWIHRYVGFTDMLIRW